MKKRALILLFLVSILAINLLFTASAQIAAIDDKVAQLKEVEKQLSAEETRNQYLQDKILEYMSSNPTGKFLLDLNDKMKTFNPIFNTFLGTDYSFSVIFFLTLIVWIIIIVYIYRSAMILNVKWMAHPKLIFLSKIGICLLAGIILSQLGLTKAIAFLLITPFYLFLTIIGIFLFIIISITLISLTKPRGILMDILTVIGSAILSFILCSWISTWKWLESIVNWITTLPGWLSKLILIILIVFALYYSSAYSKMLKVKFKKEIKEKQERDLRKRVGELENKKEDEKEEALSPEEEKELEIGKRMLITLGKELENDEEE
jgi:hypothetical protein